MNYMQKVDEWLTQLFGNLPVDDDWRTAAAKVIKDALLDSYRNGQKACPKCNPRPKNSAMPIRD
jgi:hypothetical protein